MAELYDNIEKKFIDGLRGIISNQGVNRVDFCVGYFNIRGWKNIDDLIDKLTGDNVDEIDENQKDITVFRKCRLLVGMQKAPNEMLRDIYSSEKYKNNAIDSTIAQQYKRKVVEEFRNQLTIGIPTRQDESAIKHLINQLKNKSVAVKLFLKFPLHAKLYLAYRPKDNSNKIQTILGSSNLTYSGLTGQGELDTVIADSDNAKKLSNWFEDRWNDKFCIDITKELYEVLEECWASEKQIPPYYIYLKTAYHLSQEARAGMYKYDLPKEFKQKLFEFQSTAVKIATQNLEKRGGAMIGDVVGLGKTITACAIAKIYENKNGCNTLILCPANLQNMWQDYVKEYDLKADVQSIAKKINAKDTKFYKLIIIDESHNLRNSEGTRYKNIRELIEYQNSKVLLLSATPYNKDYRDLSSQLKLFIPEDADLGIKPEAYIRTLGGDREFATKHNEVYIRSIKAFEQSKESDDWRDLMRLFLVRRTRTFVKNNYALTDTENGRKYLEFPNGKRSYFPDRIPKAVKFKTSANDQFSRLYSDEILNLLSALKLPRYSLSKYIDSKKIKDMSSLEKNIIDNLTKAGTTMMGFCKTTFMKRLDSSGISFLISVYRHILRNSIYLYAIENNKPVPIGDDGNLPEDYIEDNDYENELINSDKEDNIVENDKINFPTDIKRYIELAKDYYSTIENAGKSNIKWLPCSCFKSALEKNLLEDCQSLIEMLKYCGPWESTEDQKLANLQDLICNKHKDEKVVVFTQFSDTAEYIAKQLKKRNINHVEYVCGNSENPTEIAEKFSPLSNHKEIPQETQIRVLVATDVLSEGQNLQDSHIVINYDLPWAIIRLIQRAGRVDRIGQTYDKIYCYSFFPADGIEDIIKLRSRLNKRINENADTVGSDEVFFEGNEKNLKDLYNEKSGVLDDDTGGEVDLASQAYQIWKSATENNPDLEKTISTMSNVVYSSKENIQNSNMQGVITYAKTPDGNDILTWMDKSKHVVTQSQLTILKALECKPDEPWVKPLENHHELVSKSIDLMNTMEFKTSGILGSRFSTKYQLYTKLDNLFKQDKNTLFEDNDLKLALDDIYNYPLRETTKNILGPMLRRNDPIGEIVKIVLDLRKTNQLCIKNDNEELNLDPQIICSMGLVNK